MALRIPNETDQPNPGPNMGNPIQSRLMSMTTQQKLQQELDTVRANYQRFAGQVPPDPVGMGTQTKLAQIIHLRANEIGVTLQ